MEVVPIKVKIGLRANGHADHPAWELLPTVAAQVAALPKQTRENIDQVIRQHTAGSWHYDKTAGHADDTPESPRGQQWGMLLVSRTFADEALATFPELVTVMTRAEAVTFYNDKATVRMTDEREDVDRLQALATRRNLLLATGAAPARLAALDARIAKALDPDDPEPGVIREPLRRFATAATKWGITWHPSVLP